MKEVIWGMIGCGDVAEVKSGPAFQSIKNSSLKAVMRRNSKKAKDFALRHNIPQWYSDAKEIISHPEINAIYIATPPSSHLELAIQSLRAGKMVYLEKPITLNFQEAQILQGVVEETGVKISIAHYRRALKAYVKVRELLQQGILGRVRQVHISIRQPLKSQLFVKTEENWRINPEVSGGGYFYDIAPHQIDLMIHFFGEVIDARGMASNQSKLYGANDIVTGIMKFKDGIHFSGSWVFNASEHQTEDNCKIVGENGAISFSFYADKVKVETKTLRKIYEFERPIHIQEPMIRDVIDYFLGQKDKNPCSVKEGLEVMRIMDAFTGKPT